MTTYSTEIQRDIIRLSKWGHSSREIAGLLGISKSGVNGFLSNQPELPKEPRILFVDIETAPCIAAVFGRFNINLSQDNIIKNGSYILTASWEWLDSDLIYGIALGPDEAIHGNDRDILEELVKAIDQADIVVAHNSVKFDVPAIKLRLLANNMRPFKTVKVLDTLRMAKHFKFPSNKLDSIGAYLNIGRKKDTGGIRLWIDCIEGKQQALDDMLEYNIEDVRLLKEVYKRLAAFNSATANLGHYYDDDKEHCPACGSTNLSKTKSSVYTPISEYEELVCQECGHRSRGRSAINTKAKRSKLLVTPKVTG